jgi:hypothetical protein
VGIIQAPARPAAGDRQPRGQSLPTAALAFTDEVQGGGEGLRQFRTPTVPVVWSRITLSAVAADGECHIGRQRFGRTRDSEPGTWDSHGC